MEGATLGLSFPLLNSSPNGRCGTRTCHQNTTTASDQWPVTSYNPRLALIVLAPVRHPTW